MTHTDTELIDYLQKLTDRKHYTGKVILRESQSGRGWRLHETSRPEAVSNVRKAISQMLELENLKAPGE